jgi:uncharacterized protein YdhG (YjbR/CyaY superfamily)
MQSAAKTVDDYVAELPPERRETIVALRRLVRRCVPRSRESMQYGMPVVASADGRPLVAYCAQKHYFALYVDCDNDRLAPYRQELAHLDCGKSCIRFRQWEQLPLRAIAAILRDSARRPSATERPEARRQEARQKKPAKRAARRKPRPARARRPSV